MTDGSRFSPQYRKWLFFWFKFTGGDERGLEYYECFESLQEAENYIKRMKISCGNIKWTLVKKL